MGPVLLFDGRCVLCHRSVRWLIRRDTHAKLRFASQEHPEVARLLSEKNIQAPTDDSVWLLYNNRLYTASDAALFALRFLPAPWRYLFFLQRLPKRWRDAIYRRVAKHRYRWFGQYDVCPIPPSEHRDRFLFNAFHS